MEEPMTTVEFIITLFCQVEDHMQGLPKHPQATLWPSEVVTLGMLHALKGVSNRAFYRWLTKDYLPFFPRLPERMIVLSDTGFHAVTGDPVNLKLCQRGEWNDRMLIETVLSMLTVISHFKKVLHRVWEYFQARLAFTLAMFKLLVQWYGL